MTASHQSEEGALERHKETAAFDDEDEIDDDEEGFITTTQMPSRYLHWGAYTAPSLIDYDLAVSFAVCTDEEKRAIFPKRRPPTEALSSTSFDGVKCFELWIDSVLAGLCEVAVSGFTLVNKLILIANLEGVYLKSRYRKKGLLRPFLEVVGQSVSQELMTYIMRESRAGICMVEVRVEADLYSEGGQAAIRILGESIEVWIGQSAAYTDALIEMVLIDDAW